MLRKSGLFAIALGCLAAPVQAEEHYVLMVGIGYFPDYVYPAVGDTVRFVNTSDVIMTATADDASWTTGPVNPGEAFLVTVTDGMNQTFTNGDTAIGVIDYTNPPPLDLENNAETNH
ncbi:cupredoxin domain-containing protein [Salipiger sp.]|uniref:cupredoxin domain-containing protein n=1 Tax=Salipiger sp. TaxID=2078585 RepID=UPI003A984141